MKNTLKNNHNHMKKKTLSSTTKFHKVIMSYQFLLKIKFFIYFELFYYINFKNDFFKIKIYHFNTFQYKIYFKEQSQTPTKYS